MAPLEKQQSIRLPAVIVLLLLALFVTSSPTRAQDTVTGAFEGVVSDSQTGAALKGALVEIINEKTGVSQTLRTDFRGRFYQGLLLPGVYRIRVSTSGYETREVLQRLKITYTGEVVPVPVALDPAPVIAPTPAGAPTPPPAAPVLEDTDIRSSIITTDARRSGSFDEEEVSTLPLRTSSSRTFDYLALLLPGVLPPPETLGSVAGPGVGPGVGSAGQFSVNGLRSRGNNFTVDGADNNDEDIGVRRQGFVALIPQPIESVAEYQVITALAPAQFGRNIGGQVNAVSKSGGNETHGTVSGIFNSSQLNARRLFDTTFGNGTLALTAGGKPVRRNGQPLTVTNQSGGEDSYTFAQGGFVIGGPLVPAKVGSGRSMFYFISAEGQVTNATTEASFAVPTVEERGLFRTGATGLAQDPFTGNQIVAFPTTVSGDAVFSLYPFPNNPNGIYGVNTLTHALPSGGQSKNISGKVDGNFLIGKRAQSITSRYNFTDDWRNIPVVGGAIFSTIRPRIRTQNLSNFLNSEINGPGESAVFNQVRASYGRTRLEFEEYRDRQFLRPSRLANSLRPNERRFLLNAPLFVNDTIPNSPAVLYDSFFNFGTEDILGPVGQVSIAGFNPVGVDVFNFPQQRVNNTYQLADNLTLRTGEHSFTFGVDFRRTELHSDLPRNARPLLVFNGTPRAQNTEAGLQLNGFIRPVDLAAASAPSGVLQVVQASPESKIDLRYYQYNYFGQDDWRIRPNLSLSLGLRYEYNSPATEGRRRIENTFNSPSQALVPGLGNFLAGRTRIYDPDRKNFGPRLGIAYSTHLLGKQRLSVLRGGYGIFYDQAIGAVVSQSRNVFPNFLTLNLAGGLPNQNGVGFNITDPTRPFFPCVQNNVTTFLPIVQPGTLNTLNPAVPLSCLVAINAGFPGGFGFTLPERKLRMPMAQHYSFSLEQELNSNTVVSLAYVGTRGSRLLRLTTPNLGPNAFLIPTSVNVVNFQPNVSGLALGPGQTPNAAGAPTGGRPVNLAGSVAIYESSARSHYNSFQVQLRGRWRRSTQYQVSYTLSNAIDDVSDVFDLAGAPALPQNSFTFAGESGPANFDVRHRVAYNFVAELPWSFQIAGTGSLRTGQPFTVNSIFDVNLDGNLSDRLNTTQGLVVTGDRQRPLILTTNDPTTLLAPIGQDGAIGRNTFRAGNVIELDLSVSKNLFTTGSRYLQLRVDVFNFINRSNFGVPVRWLEAANFGQATETTSPGRRVQIVAKYSF